MLNNHFIDDALQVIGAMAHKVAVKCVEQNHFNPEWTDVIENDLCQYMVHVINYMFKESPDPVNDTLFQTSLFIKRMNPYINGITTVSITAAILNCVHGDSPTHRWLSAFGKMDTIEAQMMTPKNFVN